MQVDVVEVLDLDSVEGADLGKTVEDHVVPAVVPECQAVGIAHDIIDERLALGCDDETDGVAGRRALDAVGKVAAFERSVGDGAVLES